MIVLSLKMNRTINKIKYKQQEIQIKEAIRDKNLMKALLMIICIIHKIYNLQ